MMSTDSYAAELLSSAEAILLGRNTFDLFMDFWPEATANDDLSPPVVQLARKLEKTLKYVVSSRPVETTWKNTAHLKGPELDQVREVIETTSSRIVVLGSPSLSSSLLELILIFTTSTKFGKNQINQIPDATISDKEEKKLVDFILESYGYYNAITLSKTTHTEDPWLKHQGQGGKITDEDIKEYYTTESFAKNFPLDHSDKYYPPKTSSHYAYVFDMKKDDEASEVVFDSVDEYKQIFKKTVENIKAESGIFE